MIVCIVFRPLFLVSLQNTLALWFIYKRIEKLEKA